MLVVGRGIDKFCSSLYNKYQSAITVKYIMKYDIILALLGSKIRDYDGPDYDGPDYDGPDYDGPDFDGPDFDIAPNVRHYYLLELI
jgi:hypothetical protein